MSKRRAAFPWIATAIAALLALVVFGIQWPNLLRPKIRPDTTFPTFVLLVVVMFPVACVAIGRRRWHALEITGWVLLLVLLVASFMK